MTSEPTPLDSESRRLCVSPRSIIAALGVAVFGIALVYAYYFVFSRPMSLDEGYLMITVQGFNSGNALYDTVFTQYGPLYYFYEWTLRSMLAIPLTHDVTRLLCVFHWLTAACVLGLAAFKMTRSGMAALFVSVQTVVHLSSIANEPGHPQELVVVLLALGMLVASRWTRGRWPLETLALITALLVFTKINVGIFFGFALLLAVRCHSSDRFARGCFKWLLMAVSAVLPFLLVRHHLAEQWCRNLAALAVGAVVTTLFVGVRVSNEQALDMKKYFTMAAVFVLASAAFVAVTLFTGTSWKGLIDGLILTPLKMPKVALLILPLSNVALLNTLASIAVAMAVMRKNNGSRALSFLAVLKAAYGITGALWLIGDAKSQFTCLLPWVWLVAMPLTQNRKWSADESFARVLLALASAWQSLQAYPIAGTQVALGTFLLVLSYGICLSDAVRAATQVARFREGLAGLTPTTRLLTQALAGVVLIFLFANVWCKLPDVRRQYAKLRPLNLPGSRHVHMDDESVAMYGALSGYLAAESDTFITYPGINSLYLWTGKRPPTQLNSTGWGQLSHAQQEHILGSLAKAERPKIAVVEAMMEDWASPFYDPIRPLIRYVTEDCRPLKRIGRFMIFEPKTNAASAAIR